MAIWAIIPPPACSKVKSSYFDFLKMLIAKMITIKYMNRNTMATLPIKLYLHIQIENLYLAWLMHLVLNSNIHKQKIAMATLLTKSYLLIRIKNVYIFSLIVENYTDLFIKQLLQLVSWTCYLFNHQRESLFSLIDAIN